MCKELSFFREKRVLITGHTGFKGTWLTRILLNAGAIVAGYSRETEKEISLFELSDVKNKILHIRGDIRDIERLKCVFEEFQPEIVFHLAAQPIVTEGYAEPVYTYETNVLGTINVLECVRLNKCVKSVLNVTTDKVYRNNEWCWGYREDEFLDGFDPYSNSKSCSELVTHCYINSYFTDGRVAVSTARAGNVIGGGDFAKNRIIPDCVRAMKENKSIIVRNSGSTRPYQHVLEALMAYLTIVAKQYTEPRYQGYYNVGPDECDCITTGALVDLFCKCWGENAQWKNVADKNALHEASFLKLDCSKIKSVFGWKPKWHIEESVDMVCRFSKIWMAGGDIPKEMDREINKFWEMEDNV